MIAIVLASLVAGAAIVVPRGDAACGPESKKEGVVLSGRVRLGKGINIADVEVLVADASYDRETGFSSDDVVEGLALSESGGFLLSRPPRKIPAGRLYAVMVSARKHRLIETVVVRAFHCVEFDLILPAKD